MKWINKFIEWCNEPDLSYSRNPDYINVGGWEGAEWIKKTDIKRKYWKKECIFLSRTN